MPVAPVIPTLAYADVTEAADWLCAVFGFTVRLRIGDHRVQMKVGEGAVVLTQLRGLDAAQRGAVMVRVEDAGRLFARVQAADVACEPPEDFPYGERQFTVSDLAGHRWTFSQTIADVAPEDWGGESGVL
jgi:uncharacterized glyoxalase superfamily protein PhnB